MRQAANGAPDVFWFSRCRRLGSGSSSSALRLPPLGVSRRRMRRWGDGLFLLHAPNVAYERLCASVSDNALLT